MCEKQVPLALQLTLGNTDIKRIMLCIACISSLAPFPKHMHTEEPCQGWKRTKRNLQGRDGIWPRSWVCLAQDHYLTAL